MQEGVASEITSLIIIWDNASFVNKGPAKRAIEDKLKSILPDATQDEIDATIRHFRNRQVKEARDRQRREDIPKLGK